MKERGVGVREAARIAEVSSSTLVNWRSGTSPEDFVALHRLVKKLGTSLSWILTGEDDSKSSGTQAISEVFDDGGALFDGYAKITIQRLLPRGTKQGKDL